MKKPIGVLVLVALVMLGVPCTVELSLAARYGNERTTGTNPPRAWASASGRVVRDNCVMVGDSRILWKACDYSSQIAAEYETYVYVHQWRSTPVYVRTGVIDGSKVPPNVSLLEYCGAEGEPCEYWELVGHRGRGYVILRYIGNGERPDAIRELVDAWNSMV